MFKKNVSLARYTSYKIGGPAKFFSQPKTVPELKKIISFAKAHALPLFLLGGGTNLIPSDQGFSGVVVRLGMKKISVRGTFLVADAGADMADVLAASARAGLSGLEWAGGLPGTIGGAVRGNAGAFGGEMKDVIRKVTSLSLTKPRPSLMARKASACVFGYRTSIFKQRDGQEIILSVEPQLRKGNKKEIAAAAAEKIAYRAQRHPMEYPNAGSIFKNVPLADIPAASHARFLQVTKHDPFPVVPAAHLIAEAGLKGVSYGGAMVSAKHPNFIVNALGAQAADVKALIRLVKASVQKKFGITLEEEIMYL